MKTIIVLASLFFAAELSAQTGWRSINTPGGMSGRTEAHFFSDDLGFIFFLPSFGDPYAGLSKTSDGGKNWKNISLPANVNYYDHCILNDHSFYFEGSSHDSSVIVFTNDGGTTWSQVPVDHYCTGGISFTSDSEGYICGHGMGYNKYFQEPQDEGVIYKTSDQGKSWHKIWADSIEAQSNFGGIHFTDKLHGYAYLYYANMCMGFSDLWLTDDAGVTWKRSDLQYGQYTHHIENTNTWIRTSDWETGIYRSTDDGYTWVFTALQGKQKPKTDGNTSMSFGSDLAGYVLTYFGAVFKTTDGGTSWHEQMVSKDSIGHLYSIAATSADIAYLIGSDIVLKTISGGEGSIENVSPGKNETDTFSLSADPVSDIAFFRFPPEETGAYLQIYTIEGKLTAQSEVLPERSSLSLSLTTLPSGIYLAKLRGRTLRFVKQ